MSELVTKERLEVLASLAVKYLRDAEQAAEIELFDWACVMAGAGIEAGILAHACVCERELRAVTSGARPGRHRSTGGSRISSGSPQP